MPCGSETNYLAEPFLTQNCQLNKNSLLCSNKWDTQWQLLVTGMRQLRRWTSGISGSTVNALPMVKEEWGSLSLRPVHFRAVQLLLLWCHIHQTTLRSPAETSLMEMLPASWVSHLVLMTTMWINDLSFPATWSLGKNVPMIRPQYAGLSIWEL